MNVLISDTNVKICMAQHCRFDYAAEIYLAPRGEVDGEFYKKSN